MSKNNLTVVRAADSEVAPSTTILPIPEGQTVGNMIILAEPVDPTLAITQTTIWVRYRQPNGTAFDGHVTLT